MSSELQPGDLAIITESILGSSTGSIVQCIVIRGVHSLYGEVWQVRSQNQLVSEYGGIGNIVDVPTKWLKKIEPGSLDKVEEKTIERTN